MSLGVWQATVTDESGDIQSGASIEVRLVSDNNLVSLFSDSDGNTAISNPFTADTDGFAQFYAQSGINVNITATYGTDSIQWSDVVISTIGTESGQIPLADDVPIVLNSISGFYGLSGFDNQQLSMVSYNPGWSATTDGVPQGGGDFVYSAGLAKSTHDGVRFFSDTVPYNSDKAIYRSGSEDEDASGNGCWVKLVRNNSLSLADGGAVGVASGNATDDESADLQAVIDVAATKKWSVTAGRNYAGNLAISSFLNCDFNGHRFSPASNAPCWTFLTSARQTLKNCVMSLENISALWTSADCISIPCSNTNGSMDHLKLEQVLCQNGPAYGLYAYGETLNVSTVQRLHADGCTFNNFQYASVRLEGHVLESHFYGCFFNDGATLGALPEVTDQTNHDASPAREFRRGCVEILRWYDSANSAVNDSVPGRVKFEKCNFANSDAWSSDSTLRTAGAYISGGLSVTFDTCNFERPYPAIWAAKEASPGANYLKSSAGIKVINCTAKVLASDDLIDYPLIIWDGYHVTDIDNLVIVGDGSPEVQSVIQLNTHNRGGIITTRGIYPVGVSFSSGNRIEWISGTHSTLALISTADNSDRWRTLVTGHQGCVVGKTGGSFLDALSSSHVAEAFSFFDGQEIDIRVDTTVNGSLTIRHNSDDGNAVPADLDGRIIMADSLDATLTSNTDILRVRYDERLSAFVETFRNF